MVLRGTRIRQVLTQLVPQQAPRHTLRHLAVEHRQTVVHAVLPRVLILVKRVSRVHLLVQSVRYVLHHLRAQLTPTLDLNEGPTRYHRYTYLVRGRRGDPGLPRLTRRASRPARTAEGNRLPGVLACRALWAQVAYVAAVVPYPVLQLIDLFNEHLFEL